MLRFAKSLASILAVWIHTTATLSIPPTANSITCFTGGQGDTKTTVEGCRPTLNYLRTLPGYKKPEWFQRGRRPTIPATRPGAMPIAPPFLWHLPMSDCILEIDTVARDVVDRFTFEQARALAQIVLDDCQDSGGFGGFAKLGRGLGWQVRVVGFQLPTKGNLSVVVKRDLVT